MQGYHFELFYFQVFVNLVGLVELEGCCEKKYISQAACWCELSLVKLAGCCAVLYAAHNKGNHQGLQKEY